jgi:hypothetical protein
VLVFPLAVVLTRNFLFIKRAVIPKGVSRLLRDVLDRVGVELELGLGDVANESGLVRGHLEENTSKSGKRSKQVAKRNKNLRV